MKKHFYAHIVEIDTVFISLDLLDMKHEERQELVTIVESSVHHVVIDTVLTHLKDEDKKIFLAHLATERHDELWNFLKKKTKNIEQKIVKAVEVFKKELHKDIKKAKSKKR